MSSLMTVSSLTTYFLDQLRSIQTRIRLLIHPVKNSCYRILENSDTVRPLCKRRAPEKLRSNHRSKKSSILTDISVNKQQSASRPIHTSAVDNHNFNVDLDASEDEDATSRQDELEVGDFAIAKVSGRSSAKNFVCQVLHITPELVLKFMRKRDRDCVFFFPDVDDFAIASRDDVLLKLPVPSTGTTARSSNLFRFDFLFDSYDV